MKRLLDLFIDRRKQLKKESEILELEIKNAELRKKLKKAEE